MVVQLAAGSWVVPPNRALWIAAGLEHNVTMSGDVKMRTVYIDAIALAVLPEKVCVMNISALLRELIVAALRVLLDYTDDSRHGRLMRLIVDELQTSDILPLHLPIPADSRLSFICSSLIDQPADSATAGQW